MNYKEIIAHHKDFFSVSSKCLRYIGIIVAIPGVLTALAIDKCVAKYPTHTAFAVAFLFYLLLFLVYLLYKEKNGNLNLNKLKSTRTDTARYNILFIDDKVEYRKKFATHFGIYKFLCINEINDARLMYGFDIIILDIMGASKIGGDSMKIINEACDSYPYKYVIAISQAPELLEKCKELVDDTVIKNETFKDKLTDALLKAFTALDDPETYWNKGIMNKIGFRGKEQKANIFKTQFYHLLKAKN